MKIFELTGGMELGLWMLGIVSKSPSVEPSCVDGKTAPICSKEQNINVQNQVVCLRRTKISDTTCELNTPDKSSRNRDMGPKRSDNLQITSTLVGEKRDSSESYGLLLNSSTNKKRDEDSVCHSTSTLFEDRNTPVET